MTPALYSFTLRYHPHSDTRAFHAAPAGTLDDARALARELRVTVEATDLLADERVIVEPPSITTMPTHTTPPDRTAVQTALRDYLTQPTAKLWKQLLAAVTAHQAVRTAIKTGDLHAYDNRLWRLVPARGGWIAVRFNRDRNRWNTRSSAMSVSLTKTLLDGTKPLR